MTKRFDNVTPNNTVKKEALMKLFSEVSVNRSVYITAPSGYGKTTSVRLWLAQTGYRHVFVSLKISDDNPKGFYHTFTEAVLGVVKDVRVSEGESLLSLRDSAETYYVKQAMMACEALESYLSGKTFVLVLDDFHFIKDEFVFKSFLTIIHRMPVNWKLFLLSRRNPPMHFEPLVLKDKLFIVGTKHLRFSEKEVLELAKMNEWDLSLKENKALYKKTEGWPMAVCTLVYSKTIPDEVNVKELDHYFQRYILSNWEAPIRECLLKTSIADVINASLFQALTGREDGERWLEKLERENVFFNSLGKGNYRFHNLFREFLRGELKETRFVEEEGLYQKAAAWYAEHGQPYTAIQYYHKCGDFKSMEPIWYRLFLRLDGNASVAEHFLSIQSLALSSFPEEVVLENAYMLETRAWGYYLGGEPNKLLNDMDKLKALRKQTKNPDTLETVTLFYTVDHRRTLSEIVDELIALPMVDAPVRTVHTASLSQNLPFFHRSYRDHSDYAIDMEEKLKKMEKTLGRLVGEEYGVIEDIIRAGMFYEKNMQSSAYEYAIHAVAKIGEGTHSETAFCAYIILIEILYAMNRLEEAVKVEEEVHALLVGRKGYYLQPNFHAFVCKKRMLNGDEKIARDWLDSGFGEEPREKLLFYKIYQYFTTAKAYMVLDRMEEAITLLNNLLNLSSDYHRPLDQIESCILLSIAHRRMGSKKEADKMLVQALNLAKPYGFVRPFLEERESLTPDVGRLSYRISQPQYKDMVDSTFVRAIYIASSLKTQDVGQTGNMFEVKLSSRQRRLIELLYQGKSYQGMAEELGIKVTTVKSYLKITYDKLHASNKKEAVERAISLGIIKE